MSLTLNSVMHGRSLVLQFMKKDYTFATPRAFGAACLPAWMDGELVLPSAEL